ncbi:hypothetical protein TNCV_4967961 [Trichonephila clavipes]|nr:hypothetical protein TNCV_4967961 [Trichonephila clavipes]
MAGLQWYWARTHDMPAMIRYLDNWDTTALSLSELSISNVDISRDGRHISKVLSIPQGFFLLKHSLERISKKKTAYTTHENKLMAVISEVSELSMQIAVSELLVLHPPKNKIVERGVSVDGTWQPRGYTSMNGCVGALSVDTGKVVGIEIMLSY